MYEIYREDKYIYIVTEYCDGGELFGRLAQEKRFNEPVAAMFMHQILYGVAYCHMKGIIHGDLKPENILLDYNTHPSQQVKLADFGASRFKV
jgi:calcium-dependent protein kinase